MNNTLLFKIENNNTRLIERVELFEAINSDCNIKAIKNPEEKLRAFLLKYNTVIVNAINSAMKTKYSIRQLFFLKEFSAWKISDGIQIDIFFISYTGQLILFELKIRENINKFKSSISQTAEYMEVILKKDSDLIISSFSKNKNNMKRFNEFIKNNNIDLNDLKNNMKRNLNNKDIKAIIALDKIDDKVTQEFEETIRYTNFIKANIMLMELCAYKINQEYIIYLNFYKNIDVRLQPKFENILQNIYNIMDYRSNENTNKILNELKQIRKYNDVEVQDVNKKDDLMCIKSTKLSKQELSKLIVKEIYRLTPTSICSLFNNVDLDERIPSRTVFYQIFGEDEIKKIKDTIDFINYKTKDDKKEYVINKLQEFYKEHKYVPSTKECTEIIGIHYNTIRYIFGKYSDALIEAGLKPRLVTSPSKEEIIQEIKTISKLVKKNTVAEYKNNGARYHWYLKYFGSFESALEISGVTKKYLD